ncbi:tRNA (guanine(46)-N(7))-methyltransferase TrmB [Prosthecochloris sp. CIB 2401]|uniref:tRNA (guanine(46)-N(7))-methyltransferase TrmB n=1 Tax=Prosthecochloris sp. CIB 2401 TaxID=1868325 RepID=UPI00080A96A4|nr:tRNA (guanine-N7)-methyltransferase [Prosthecochloris sp. CIB 2401]ANT65474.1 tRNA (guanine-N(7)-)-methyltransferase [Prosthecochloris sp. CIB 2401]
MPDQQTHDLNNLLGARVTEVEIGFGDGEHLIRRASEHPERTFIGIEKKSSRAAVVATTIERKHLDNILILQSCAHEAFRDLLPSCSISRIYALFPDPWPKRKHVMYRLFSSEYLRLMNNRLQHGGEALIVTDSEQYYHWILKQTPGTGFVVEHDTIPPLYNTRFERKWVDRNQHSFFRIRLEKTRHIEMSDSSSIAS